MYRIITGSLLTALCVMTQLLFAQTYDDRYPPNTYRNADNPHYWKNNDKLSCDYWQQDVHYQIKATIIDSLNIINGTSYKLTYWNNSPDTLTHLYFHLYQEAFQPHSHMHNLYQNNNKNISFGEYEAQGLGTSTENIKINGAEVSTEKDNTILKVTLNEPLLPDDSLVVSMAFKTYFDEGGFRRRMKTFTSDDERHFDGVHWYPSIAVYDAKFKWTTEQHLDKEFYANFGTFDVNLTFPNDYIVGATGNLINKAEMLPDTLMEKIKLSNFKEKRDTISQPIKRDDARPKTWKFHAENVHNFAFTADPTYRIGELKWKGITIQTLARESNAHGWQRSGTFAKNVIKRYSEDFGMYAWPKIIIADAKDGMEYPMLTLDNGTYPQHQYLLAHELGHMWFYGMLGSNETYRAMMDEGFTQFLTVWSMDSITGPTFDYSKHIKESSKNKYYLKHLAPKNHRYDRLYLPYVHTVWEGYDYPLNTHSSDFRGAVRHGGGYGLVYYKMGVMMYNLMYVLGKDTFLEAMQYYVEKFKMAHPYPEDFRTAITESSGTDLNWFFDQWLETTKHIDYAIDKVDKKKDNHYTVTFQRKGTMQMPVDFTVYLKNGETVDYYIPNTWYIKNTDATVLPKWYGWGAINPTYTADIEVDGEIDYVEIDPEKLMADIDLRNNRWPREVDVSLAHGIRNKPDWFKSTLRHRPDLWYNSYDGLQVGYHAEGNYFNKTGIYSASVWYNTGLGQRDIPAEFEDDYRKISAHLEAEQSLKTISPHLRSTETFKYNAGLLYGDIGLRKRFQPQDTRQPEFTDVFISHSLMYRQNISDLNYLIYPGEWNVGNVNSFVEAGFTRRYKLNKGTGDITLKARTPGIRSDVNYSFLEMKSIHDFDIKKLHVRTRLFGRYGFGNTPQESALFLAGANPEEMYGNKYTRAGGFFPDQYGGHSFEGSNHFHYGGGLNLRGYAGYYAPEGNTVGDSLVYRGTSGSSINIEVAFTDYFGIKKPSNFLKYFSLDTYAFTDAGIISYENNTAQTAISRLRMDAGLGSALSIRFGRLDVPPLVVRFDMPFFLNRPQAQQDYVDFSRFVIGVERAF